MRWAGKSLQDGPTFLLEAGGVGTLRYVSSDLIAAFSLFWLLAEAFAYSKSFMAPVRWEGVIGLMRGPWLVLFLGHRLPANPGICSLA